MERKELEPGVFTGPQLGEEGLRRLPEEGIVAVIDLRRPEENGNLLRPQKESEIVQEMGLKYVHIPVDWKRMDFDQADRFRAALADVGGPVYVHSRHHGDRAATFVLIDRAIRKNQDPKSAARTAEQLGVIRAGTRADDFVAQYIAARIGDEEV